jgi:ATP-dependent DNA helicase RecG
MAREAAEKLLVESNTLEAYPLIQKELQARYQKLVGADILT